MRKIETRDLGLFVENYFMFEGQEIHVIENMSSFTGCVIAMHSDLANRIYVDNYFLELTEETQNFILYHELGHAHYEHKGGTSYTLRRAFSSVVGWVIKEERKADLYAYNKVGKEVSLNAISEFEAKFVEIMNEKGIAKKQAKHILREIKSRYSLIKMAK